MRRCCLTNQANKVVKYAITLCLNRAKTAKTRNEYKNQQNLLDSIQTLCSPHTQKITFRGLSAEYDDIAGQTLS
jgi:hypothetical protein